jgi:hypothetical protein
VVSRAADPAKSFSRVRGLEVTALANARGLLRGLAYARELLRGDVLRGEAIDMLDVEADRGSGGNVVRFRLETIQAPGPGDGIVEGFVCGQQEVELGTHS